MGSRTFRSRVKAIASSVVKASSETKWKEWTYGAQAISTSAVGNVVDQALNTISGGSGKSARDGNQIFMSGLHGKFVIAGADTTNIIRVILYIPKDHDDTLTADVLEVKDIVNMDKYTVLTDFYITTSQNGNDAKTFSIRRKFNKGKKRGIVTQWQSSTSTDFSKNPLRLYIVSDSGIVSHPALTGYIKLFYKDG